MLFFPSGTHENHIFDMENSQFISFLIRPRIVYENNVKLSHKSKQFIRLNLMKLIQHECGEDKLIHHIRPILS